MRATRARAGVLLPEVAGALGPDEVLASAASIARVQRADGMIPWFPGGHCDPWNHVESAMALSVCGLDDEAERAYQWLADRQLGDGSWFNYYLGGSVKDPRLDTNVCAYLATGLWHHQLVTGETALLARLWPALERALDFVLRWQRPDGSILWSLDQSGRPEDYALLTGSCSIFHALRCGMAAAAHLGHERPEWELAAGRLRHAVAHHPGAFAPKDEFAMDWYYPMLSGALDCVDGRARAAQGWSTFVLDGLGVRCVSTGDWVTAAETAECVLALDGLGLDIEARDLFGAGQRLRMDDGSYWTGIVFPDEATFPPAERTTYTAAAMVLAADALSGATGGSGLFRGEGIPRGWDLAAPRCTGAAADGCTAIDGAAPHPGPRPVSSAAGSPAGWAHPS